MDDIDPNDLIVLDESGANLGMTSDYARAEGGERAKSPKPGNVGDKFSILGAISLTCIVAISYLQSAVDTDVFEAFIRNMLVSKLRAGQYVLMDNVKFHKNSAIIELIEKTGAKVVFLPPYSPELSPIEKMWSKIKNCLKKLKPRTKAEFYDAIANSADEVTDDDLAGWYEECGYSVAV